MKQIPSIQIPASLQGEDKKEGCVFDIGYYVKHTKGGIYRVLRLPTDHFLEETAEPCYIYMAVDGTSWARRQSEFEDGRFTLLAKSACGAIIDTNVSREDQNTIFAIHELVFPREATYLREYIRLNNPKNLIAEYEKYRIQDLFGFSFEAWSTTPNLVYTRCLKLAKDLYKEPT